MDNDQINTDCLPRSTDEMATQGAHYYLWIVRAGFGPGSGVYLLGYFNIDNDHTNTDCLPRSTDGMAT